MHKQTEGYSDLKSHIVVLSISRLPFFILREIRSTISTYAWQYNMRAHFPQDSKKKNYRHTNNLTKSFSMGNQGNSIQTSYAGKIFSQFNVTTKFIPFPFVSLRSDWIEISKTELVCCLSDGRRTWEVNIQWQSSEDHNMYYYISIYFGISLKLHYMTACSANGMQ